MFEGPQPQRETLVQTEVAVYLGDCSGASLRVVCDGTSVESEGTIWQRAADALVNPSPRGPYPVSDRFTMFVHEARLVSGWGDVALVTIRTDVMCRESLAHVSVQSEQSRVELAPISFSMGDDIVTIARAVLRALS